MKRLFDLAFARLMFQSLGVATASYFLFRVSNLFYERLLRPSSITRFLRKDKEAWALVTGASDGIGFGFCQELASHGFNLILHGRNRPKLDRVAARLVEDFPSLQTRIFVADAAKPVLSFDALTEMVRDIKLTVLVNNVGGTGNLSRDFMNLQEQSLDEIDGTLNLNAGFTTKITSTILPVLLNNEPSLILNIGSLAALGVPKLSVYAGTKGYLESHSESLYNELVAQGRDVTVHAVVVASVQSQGNTMQPGLLVPTSRRMARDTLARVGARDVAITPYFPHACMMWFMTAVPRRIRMQSLIAGAKDAEALLSKSR